MANKVLIIAMNKQWIGISRLPSGLARAGFTIYALCPKGSYLSLTKYLNKAILFPIFTYSRSKIIYLYILYALIKFRPDLIIPGDEEAILVLQNLYYNCLKFPYFKKISHLIRKSLSDREFDKMIFSKSAFLNYCEKWKVQAPRNIEVKSMADAQSSAIQLGYPVVLKLDAGYGGSGVFICQNEKDLNKYFHSIKKHSPFKRLTYVIKNLFFITIFDKELKISVQQYIKGTSGHVSFCALNGKLLAANPMLGIRTYPGATGPSSVSQGFDNNLLLQFAQTVASKLNYNGFGSLDFMCDEINNNLFIIELNSRPTPTCHLSSHVVTNDLCSIYYKAINKEKIAENSFKAFTIAMYPNEQNRDPNSHFLKEAYHDVPFDDVQLMNALATNS